MCMNVIFTYKNIEIRSKGASMPKPLKSRDVPDIRLLSGYPDHFSTIRYLANCKYPAGY